MKLAILVAIASVLDLIIRGVPDGIILAIDPGTALLLSGLASAGGGLLQAFNQPEARKIGDTPLSAFRAGADPIAAQLGFDALLGLGRVDEGILQESSPINRLVNVAQQSGDFRRDDLTLLTGAQKALTSSVNKGLRKLRRGEIDRSELTQFVMKDARSNTEFERGRLVLRLAMGAAGIGNFSNLIQQQSQFQQETEQFVEQARNVTQAVQTGRLDALQGIAALQSDFPIATAAAQQQFEQEEIARQNREFDLRQRELFEQANALGFNPGAGLGLLESDRATALLDARQRAQEIQAGRQGLSTQAIGALLGSLGQQDARAQAAAGLRQNAQLTAASIGAQQAQALANLQAQQQQPSLAAGIGQTLSGLGGLGIASVLAGQRQPTTQNVFAGSLNDPLGPGVNTGQSFIQNLVRGGR